MAIINGTGDNDFLGGTTDADTLRGRGGNDTYTVNHVADRVIEQADEGIDTVYAYISHTLAANVENLLLVVEANINGTGNALDNLIFGGQGRNIIDGGRGDDILYGGFGQDRLLGGPGDDTLYSAGEAAIFNGGALIRDTSNETLFGEAGDDYLQGGVGDDLLDGGTGTDEMVGLDGNDTYVVDSSDDLVSENADAGLDTVNSSVTHVLTAHVENLVLTGRANLNGVGNALDNALTGNGGRNLLNGGFGNDSLKGGAGDDQLGGGYGDDALDGGLGNDRLNGARGNDTYGFARGGGVDRIIEADDRGFSRDTLNFATGVAHTQLWFRRDGSDLEVSIIGTRTEITVQNWFNGVNNQVETFNAGGKSLGSDKVNALVAAMAGFTKPSLGTTTLPAAYQVVLNPVIASSWTT